MPARMERREHEEVRAALSFERRTASQDTRALSRQLHFQYDLYGGTRNDEVRHYFKFYHARGRGKTCKAYGRIRVQALGKSRETYHYVLERLRARDGIFLNHFNSRITGHSELINLPPTAPQG